MAQSKLHPVVREGLGALGRVLGRIGARAQRAVVRSALEDASDLADAAAKSLRKKRNDLRGRDRTEPDEEE